MLVREGSPSQRGAHWDGDGVNFALFSANATKVEVCFFDHLTGKETARIELPEYSRGCDRGVIAGAPAGWQFSPFRHGRGCCLPRRPRMLPAPCPVRQRQVGGRRAAGKPSPR